ncbi:MAG TPA: 1,4-dihydroxy-2-naphthoate polyprenyltransferase [Anaerolineales bacterium]
MTKPEQSLSPFKVWVLASRPKTLSAAAAGVITGTALALHDGHFRFGPALAALLVALLLQIGSNLANDVYDYERGTDAGERHGPTRVTQAQLLTPAQVKAGMLVVFGLAGLLGLYLASVAGWVVILIGLAAILSAIAYTGGPFPLGYHGLGDLFVFIFFGVAAVAGTYFVQAGTVSAQAWWMSIPIGLLIVDILVVNNLRDIHADRAAGKHTLAVRLGEHGSRVQYIVLLALAYLILPLLVLFDILPWQSLLAWLSFPLGWRTWQIVREQAGRPLNVALAGTGQTTLVYSLLFFVGMLLV